MDVAKFSALVPRVARRLLDAGVDLAGPVGDLAADRVGEARGGIHVHDDGAVAFEADLDARLLAPTGERLEFVGLGMGQAQVGENGCAGRHRIRPVPVERAASPTTTYRNPGTAIQPAACFQSSHVCALCVRRLRPLRHRRHARTCSGHPRSLPLLHEKPVDGRDEPGHDERGGLPRLLHRLADLVEALRQECPIRVTVR